MGQGTTATMTMNGESKQAAQHMEHENSSTGKDITSGESAVARKLDDCFTPPTLTTHVLSQGMPNLLKQQCACSMFHPLLFEGDALASAGGVTDDWNNVHKASMHAGFAGVKVQL
jgi:hypothetical protein